MVLPAFRRLTEAEKDALLQDQQALVGKLPSKDDFRVRRPRDGKGGKHPSRVGTHRPLASDPDKTERVTAPAFGHCGTDV